MASKKDLVRIPTDVDKYAGEQLRNLRISKGLSQRDLSVKVGVTFQQLQKYEKGLNRIGISRLYDLCNILDVKPSYFFKKDDSNPVIGEVKRVAEGSDTSLITDVLMFFREMNSEDQKKVIKYIKKLKKKEK